MNTDVVTAETAKPESVSQVDLDMGTWKSRNHILGNAIRNACARDLVKRYLEHRAIGGRVKTFLAENDTSWMELNEHLHGKVEPLVQATERLRSRVLLRSAEDELQRRSIEGIDKPVFHQGIVCGHIRQYSDTLLALMLRAEAPDKYAERQQIEHKGVVLNLHVAGVR